MASEFYLVLPSNSSMVTHPNNTLAQYITNLPRRISLSGYWECGLTEIHYPHDWYNVRNARLTVEHDGNVESDAYFEDGYYDSTKALAKKLNGDKPGRVKLSYEPVMQKFLSNVKREITFTLYGDLPDILGFGAGTGDSSSTSLASSTRLILVRGYSIVDLRRGLVSLYVYSSIVEPHIVGDNIAPLLRIVPITGSHGEMVTARFDHVQYIPLLSREFGSVEIEIRYDTGRPVPFERGKVTVTLHFRRCSSGLFKWITTTTMRGRWVGHCPTLPGLVSMGFEVCSVVYSERLPLWSEEVLSLWGSVRWRMERRFLAMSWRVRTSRRRQNEGQRLLAEIWCKASSTHHHLPVDEWSV